MGKLRRNGRLRNQCQSWLCCLAVWLPLPAVQAQGRIPDLPSLNSIDRTVTHVQSNAPVAVSGVDNRKVEATLPAVSVGTSGESVTGPADTGTTAPVAKANRRSFAAIPATAARRIDSVLEGKPEADALINQEKTWALRVEDERIDLALQRWSMEAGVSYRWDADRWFPIAAPSTFSGTYEQAIIQLLSSPGILNSTYPLEACIYANQPPLIRITRMGDQSQECR